jgi:hypothetical protein
MSTYSPVASQTLSASASSVTFSNIPQDYTDLILVITRKTDSGTYQDMKMQINGDTGNSYSTTTLAGYGTSSVESLRYSNQSSSIFVDVDAQTSPTANIYNPVIIQLMNYSNSTTYKTWLVRGGNSATGVEAMVGLWRSTSAINSLTFSLTASTFSSGSTFSLYGIQAGTPKAQGGQIVTTDGTYWYHAFRASGTFTPTSAITADVLVVAGGGGGSAGNATQGAGGGGAGGLRVLASQSLSANTTYSCLLGAGGSSGVYTGTTTATSGSNTTFASLSASGGGFGARTGAAGNGGSGGGTVYNGSAGSGNSGSYSPVEGYAGSTATAGDCGGGGGGASSAGASGNNFNAGNGGSGANSYNSITFTSWLTATNTGVSGYLAGGGGGGEYGGRGTGAGGSGGGGTGGNQSTNNSTSGTVNSGSGGGGGGGAANGGNGGSGIVIIRYSV